jgi:hypothetical protein
VLAGLTDEPPIGVARDKPIREKRP